MAVKQMVKEREKSRIAQLISDRIEELKGYKLQREIASQAGYNNPNMIALIKKGDAKVALDRIPRLAEALEVEPSMLMRLAFEQFYEKETADEFFRLMSRGGVTRNEQKILDVIREASGNTDPPLDTRIETGLKDLFSA